MTSHLPARFLVVEDHALFLSGTIATLKDNFPEAAIKTATTAQAALEEIATYQPDVVLLDLAIPPTKGGHEQTEVGLNLLQHLMDEYRDLNFTILTTYPKRLITIVSRIEHHEGGFTVANKNLPTSEMIQRVKWAYQGITHTRDIPGIRAGIELRPEWLQVLQLICERGLQDKEIAKKMSVSERTVRLYIHKVQDALGIYPEDRNGKINLRIKTCIKARQKGLIENVMCDE